MGDQDKSIFILLEIPLQPFDMLGVQVVGGLVQKKDVRLLQKQLSQEHLGPLASGKLVHVLIQSDLIQAKGPADLLHLGVDDIKVMGHQKVLDGPQLLHHGIHLLPGSLSHMVADLVHLFFHLK